MRTRMLCAWAVVLLALCSVAVAGAPRPPTPPPPPPSSQPAPGAVRCHKCNGTGYRWDDNRWKPCKECNGAGWLYPRPGRPPGHWYPRHRDRYYDDCFVATAAYGTVWEPKVATLRSFRDDCLMSSPVGRGFVDLYYCASPPMAAWIAERPWARAATRIALTPLVIAAGAFEGNPADIGLVAGAAALGFLLVRAKRALRRRSLQTPGPLV